MTFLPPLCSSPLAARFFKDVTHIYTDLDGTLFAPGGRLLAAHDGSPSAATAQALVALKQAGIEVIIVTGRNLEQGNEIMRLLNIDTFIGELGCAVQEGYGAFAQINYELGDWENIILADGLAPGEVPANTTPAELILASNIIDRLVKEFPGKVEPHILYRVTREVTLMLRGNIDCERAERILDEGPLPLQILDNGVIHPKNHTLVDCPEIHIYHLMPKGADKGTAVAADMARRGLIRSQTVAVGDAIGDMAMGEHTGSFVLINGGDIESVVRGYNQSQDSLDGSGEPGGSGGSGGPSGSGRRDGRDGYDERNLSNLPESFGSLFVTQGKTADGWLEFANSLLDAKT